MTRTRILIIETDCSWAQNCEAVLRRAGYEAEVTDSLNDMRKRLSRDVYELVIVPSYMKPYGYFEPVRAVSEACLGRCAFVVTTNVRSEADMEMAYRLGAYRYLVKEVDPARLVKALPKVLSAK